MKNQTSTTVVPVVFSYVETFVKITRFGMINGQGNQNIFGFEDIITKVSDRDPIKILKKTTGIISFKFFDRQTIDGKTKETNLPAEYVPGAKIFTKDEIKKDPDAVQILIDMEEGNWEKVIVSDFTYCEYKEGKFITL